MKLQDILKGLNYEVIKGEIDIPIKKISYDSRKVNEGDLFVCIKGYNSDGHDYIKAAVEKGASAILLEEIDEKLAEELNVSIIRLENTRKGLAECAANYFQNPLEKLKVIGVTGTNGKTTSTYLIKYILEEAGYKVGILGTIQNMIGSKKFPTERTTLESLELQEMFSLMVEDKVDYCVMEVSSHSLYLDRVYGITFSEAIFTNLTKDHLDFHKTFENYYQAKLILFKNSLNNVVNIDDEYGKRICDDIEKNITTVGVEKKSDVMAKEISLHSRGVDFIVKTHDREVKIKLNLPGRYNIYNALGCAAACLNEGISIETIANGLNKMPGVPGRCELASLGYDLDYEIIIDYAHSPDSLLNILKTVREFTENRIITVFGCGGDRDKTKRPEMGDIGTRLSDYSIITSDNPRTEEPLDIIKDILNGIIEGSYEVVENRKEAIKKALSLASKGDVVLIAGKGHEDYQILKQGKIHFDEREIIREVLINKKLKRGYIDESCN